MIVGKLTTQRSTRSRPLRSGLTLIELIAALSLSAMFMAVLLGMVGRLSSTRDTLKQQKPFEPWKYLLKQQLQRDYMGCRSVAVSSKRIRISGYSQIAGVGSTPSEIEYRIRSNNRGNWMYRVARPLSGDSGFAQRELVCCTIATFKTRTALDTDVAPGVLVLDMQVVPAAAASSAAGKTAAEIPNDLNVPVEVKKQNPFSVVLIRHGAGR